MSDSESNPPHLPPTEPTTPPPPPPAPPASTPPVDPGATTQMPTTPPDASNLPPTAVMPPAGFGTPPPGGVPPTSYEPEPFEEPRPWYKQPGPLIAIIIVVLLLAGFIAWLLLRGDDDKDAPTSAVQLVFKTTDENGAVLDRGFVATVTGPPGEEDSFTWLQPAGIVAPGDAAGTTGTDGRIDFWWEPTDDVADPANWASTVSVIEQIPVGWTPPGPTIDCALQHDGQPDTTVAMNISVDPADETVARLATLTFPNQTFLPGDNVTCELVSFQPPETTTTTTTTVPETTTTTVVETTTVETTTTAAPTTAAPTTAAPTTVAPSTTVPVTAPPDADATVWDVIDKNPDLSELRDLVGIAGLQDQLSDPDATYTLFAPSNAAIEAARADGSYGDLTDPAVVTPLLLAHTGDQEALSLAQLLSMPSVDVLDGGPQPIDASADPPTIGGAHVLVADVAAANGVVHEIDKVLTPQP